jgi:hypothetical protein
VTDSRLPMGFTITPYAGEAAAVPAVRPRQVSFRIGSRVVAAGLALAAAWAPVLQVTQPVPGSDGYIRYSINGWGQGTVQSNLDFSIDTLSGTNFGLLLCSAAGGLAIAALLDWLPHRPWWQPSGRSVAGLAIAFLLAVVLCEVITSLPTRWSSQVGHSSAFHFGLSPWLGGIACLIAALSCLQLPARGTAAPEPDVAYWRG